MSDNPSVDMPLSPPTTTKEKNDTPPSPTPVKRQSRRSSMARSRRLSRASGAGIISLEEQLGVVPSKEEANTQERLKKTVSLCLNASVRQVKHALNAEDEDSNLVDLAQDLAAFLQQGPLLNDDSLKELGDKLDTTLVVVKPEDVVPARVKAVREYTAKLNKEAQEWKDLLVERKQQYGNAVENARAAGRGEIVVDDNQRFSLTAKEKTFFKNLPNYNAAMAQVASHERKQALAARNMATEAKKLKRKLEDVDIDLTKAAKVVIERASSVAQGMEDPRELFGDVEDDGVVDVKEILVQVDKQRQALQQL